MPRIIYLGGPVEAEGDTWRERTGEAVTKLGFDSLNPLRNELLVKVGHYVKSNLSDRQIVSRDLHDLHRVKLSGGFVIMNLNTTKDGRRPIGSLFELQWCKDHDVPVLAVINDKLTHSTIRTHPWVLETISYRVSSVTESIQFIRENLLDDKELREIIERKKLVEAENE